MNTTTRKFYTTLVFVLATLLSTNTYAVLDHLGIGLDIIQGKEQTEYAVVGDSCGETQIFIHDSNGNLVLSSPVFDEAGFSWYIDVTNWSPGTYSVFAQSENCSLQETLTLN